MRHSFEGRHSELPKEIVRREQGAEDDSGLQQLYEDVASLVVEYSEASRRHLNLPKYTIVKEKNIQKRGALIVSLQREKQKRMDLLHEQLRCLDDPECASSAPRGARKVSGFSESELLVEEKGKRKAVSLGDLIADRIWGIEHSFDRETVPRRIQKKYFLATAREDLFALFDQQIGKYFVHANANRKLRGMSPEAIKAKMEKYENPGFSEKRKKQLQGALAGNLAERLVYSFGKRHAFSERAQFSIRPATVVEDALAKADLILTREKPAHVRGVEVQSSDYFGVGLQLKSRMADRTIGREGKPSKKIQNRFHFEKEEFDSVAVLPIPGSLVYQALRRWLNEGMPSGGPEQYLGSNQRQKLFFSMLWDMFSKEEIESQWQGGVDSAGRS